LHTYLIIDCCCSAALGSVHQDRGTVFNQKVWRRYCTRRADHRNTSRRGRPASRRCVQSFGRRSASRDDAGDPHWSDTRTGEIFPVPALSVTDWRSEVSYNFLTDCFLFKFTFSVTKTFTENYLHIGNIWCDLCWLY